MKNVDEIIETSLKEKMKVSRNLKSKFNDKFLKSLYVSAPIIVLLFSSFILFAFILKFFLFSIFIFLILLFFVFKLCRSIYAYIYFKNSYEKIRDTLFNKNCIFRLKI